MTQEALKLALEALITITDAIYVNSQQEADAVYKANDAVKAIKEALAQTQEPFAWVKEDVCDGQYIDGRPRKIWWECEKGVGTAFYTAPPQRTEQEPVAWREFIEQVAKQKPEKPDYWSSCSQCERNINDAEDLLEATPPQEQQSCDKRTWVGLTDEEIDSYFEDHGWSPSEGYYPVIKNIEDKLRSKNGY